MVFSPRIKVLFSPAHRCGTPALGADAERRQCGHRRPVAVGVPGSGEASALLQLAEERSAADSRGEFQLYTLAVESENKKRLLSSHHLPTYGPIIRLTIIVFVSKLYIVASSYFLVLC